MAPLIQKLISRFKKTTEQDSRPIIEDEEDGGDDDRQESLSLAKRLARRRWLLSKLMLVLPRLSTLLLIAGFLAALILPTDLLSRSTYISENALQPAQVNTYWSWSNVHSADRFSDLVNGWRHLPSNDRAKQISTEFEKIGLRSQTQSYVFRSLTSNRHPSTSNGTNVHAILHSSRTDGSESLVLMASWLTRKPGSDIHGGDLNIRGVASVLALAEYLVTFNLWSKDIIFLIADGLLDGTHAWLKAYHEVAQPNLEAQPLDLRTGPIWAALNIDYPFHSFSHIGIGYEGINGQLPNLDFINTVAHITRWTSSTPVTMHAEALVDPYPPHFPDHPILRNYYRAGSTIVQQIAYGLTGMPSGPEGIFGTYRIDAIGVFAYPADGPHGFHTMGRIVESTLRSLNNLLERFHQSFFLYLLHSQERFLSVAMYLVVPLLMGLGLSLRGLGQWGKRLEVEKARATAIEKNSQGEKSRDQDLQRAPEILWSLRVIGLTHLMGAATFWGIIRSVDPDDAEPSLKIYGVMLLFASLPFLIPVIDPPTRSVHSIFEPVHLLLSGCLISVISVLNFPLGTGLGVVLGIPGVPFLSLLLGLFKGGWKRRIMLDDQILDSWILPFAFVIVLPLFVQATLVILLAKKSSRNL